VSVIINGVVLGHQNLNNMSRFLESSERIEKPVLNTVGNQAKQLVDDLLPQIRLAAFENEGCSVMDIRIGFEFAEDGENCKVCSEGIVQFPAKRAYAEEVCEK
jgi:hypothetical protein